MSFADDLLTQAYHLANKERKNPKQASLRRAVSTAYYALFHLLIDEAVGNWGRSFYSSGGSAAGLQLKIVAQTFAILQQQRHTADYDNGFHWSRTNAIGIDLASSAFKDWRAIRTTDAAQDFLLTLFLPKLPRP